MSNSKPKLKNYVDVQELIPWLVSELDVTYDEIDDALIPTKEISNGKLIYSPNVEDLYDEELDGQIKLNPNKIKILKKIQSEFPNVRIYYWW